MADGVQRVRVPGFIVSQVSAMGRVWRVNLDERRATIWMRRVVAA